MTTKPFWEEQYAAKDGLKTFAGGKPSLYVQQVVEKHLGSGCAVEFGCGAGRDALYLAANGFDVTAVDISKTGIATLNHAAEERGLRMNAYVGDVRDFVFDGPIDLFVSFGCIHLVPTVDQEALFANIMGNTRPGGYNVVSVFTDEVPTPSDMEPFFVGLFNKGALFDIYRDWEMIVKDEYVFNDDHGNGLKHTHAGHRLIARKPVE